MVASRIQKNKMESQTSPPRLRKIVYIASECWRLNNENDFPPVVNLKLKLSIVNRVVVERTAMEREVGVGVMLSGSVTVGCIWQIKHVV